MDAGNSSFLYENRHPILQYAAIVVLIGKSRAAFYVIDYGNGPRIFRFPNRHE
jgi:hypothetical protein